MSTLVAEISSGFNFSVSENQQMVAQMVKDFAEKHIRPNVIQWTKSRFSR